ncbi:hypothetical protein PQR34_47660 [Paraburkholderia sediminicola]|uniref:hypothetical protein n=1 Tax=Paraburkholderia sediminicola TaxID=458836 RepID=UPI00105DECDE
MESLDCGRANADARQHCQRNSVVRFHDLSSYRLVGIDTLTNLSDLVPQPVHNYGLLVTT